VKFVVYHLNIKNVSYVSVCVSKSSASCDDGYIDCRSLATATAANLGKTSVESRKNATDRRETVPPQECHHRKTSTESGKNVVERRESEPLLSQSASGHTENAAEDLADHGVEDLTDDHGVVVPAGAMYRCLSRSCSIGSQLSAAASSTLHEESFSDLTLDTAGTSPSADYLPMSRIGVPSKDDVSSDVGKDGGSVVAPTGAKSKFAASDDEKLPLIAGTRLSRGDAAANYVLPSAAQFSTNPATVRQPAVSEGYQNARTANDDATNDSPSIDSAHSAAAGNYVLPSSGRLATNPTSVRPLPASAGYRSTRQHNDVDDGYLQFRSIPATPPSDDDDDRNSLGSLERLGPPPEIPTLSAAADYIVPVLPPKPSTSSGLRANSLLLSSKPTVINRRRGSADSHPSTAIGPLRENTRDSPSLAGLSNPSAGLSARPASERRASRKPNLTVDAVASANIAYTGESCN